MELRELARAILFSDRLEDKLVRPERVTDERPGSTIDLPAAPARTKELKFSDTRAPFPRPSALVRPEARGRVLHFFANHELLACELMALVLLRFPDAPKAFRRGLAETIADEQRHLALYQARMQTLGVALGEVPVNRFFWDTIGDVPTPLDFVTRMSLTFEQANLDYSLHYEALFSDAEDEETAALMREVYEDEIGHVSLGLHWFRRWKPAGVDDWTAYVDTLAFPLTPSRAKGPIFDLEGRRRAGFDAHFSDELAVYSHSKGRPPAVHFFNPGCESERADGHGSYTPSSAVRGLTEDLSTLMMFLAKRDDTVIVPKRPSASFLMKLERAGFVLPEFVECETAKDVERIFADRQVARCVPWGWSPRAERFDDALGPAERGAPPTAFSKVWAAEHAARFAAPCELSWARATVCRDVSEVEAACRQTSEWRIKAPWGSAGQEQLRGSGAIPDGPRGFVEKTLQKQGAVLVEPQLDRVADLSVRIDVGDRVRVRGPSQFFTDARGRYRAHALGAAVLARPLGLRRWLLDGAHGPSRRAQMLEIAERVGEALFAEGYRGPASMDALVYRHEGALHLRPLLEVNVRHTMGHIADVLEAKLAHASAGLWLHVDARDVRAFGFGGFTEYAQHLRAPEADGVIVFTNDPERAQHVLTVVSLDRDPEVAWRQLGLGDDFDAALL